MIFCRNNKMLFMAVNFMAILLSVLKQIIFLLVGGPGPGGGGGRGPGGLSGRMCENNLQKKDPGSVPSLGKRQKVLRCYYLYFSNENI